MLPTGWKEGVADPSKREPFYSFSPGLGKQTTQFC
ncbi:hypothetical protein GALL_499370 [mine drainage metagenome]|uniref:Uncharacterized protein n=1 Tax=mine drainage metagenome TaxID=410659 RepID=A0A1J5PXX2_9ZZZZ